MGARRYGGKSAKERSDARRELLLDAALSLFGTAGYASTSIERLCAEAGVIARYFYESFPSREALLVAVYDGIILDTERSVEGALAAASPDPLERMVRGVRAFVRSYVDDPRRGRIVCLEVVGVSPALERHRRQDVWRFARIIDQESKRLARAGLLPDRDSRYTARALAGATHELIVDWLTAPSPLSRRRLEQEILLVYMATFAGGAAAVAALGRIRRDAARPPRSRTERER